MLFAGHSVWREKGALHAKHQDRLQLCKSCSLPHVVATCKFRCFIGVLSLPMSSLYFFRIPHYIHFSVSNINIGFDYQNRLTAFSNGKTAPANRWPALQDWCFPRRYDCGTRFAKFNHSHLEKGHSNGNVWRILMEIYGTWFKSRCLRCLFSSPL